MWLAAPGAVQVGDDELFFITRTNAAEGVSLSLDPTATGWESEIAVGRLRRHGLVSLDAPYSRWVARGSLRRSRCSRFVSARPAVGAAAAAVATVLVMRRC